ncbi:MAG: ATP-dependent Clp protease ATP-binding subunit [Ruminococcaceae bacterium]|nr:ATP-dependent Clp protease ATP-binding subunit [Oscillospiraceae bacterium]
MDSLMCSKCGKRKASIFITQLDPSGNQENKGLCLLCAKQLGLPQIDSLVEKMGLSDEDLEQITEEMDNMMEALGGEENIMAEAVDDETHNTTNTPNLFDFFRKLGPSQKAESGSTADDGKSKKDGKKDDKKKDKKGKDADSLKALNQYGINLNQKAIDGLVDNVIGRDREIDRIVQILNRRSKNNPCLIGEPGVGKTAIAEGLALNIVKGKVPYKLSNKLVYLLDLTSVVAGTQFRGQFEARMKAIIDEVKKAGNIILVIDEVHNIMGAGEAEGSMNAANILKPALSRGEIQVIGATTLKEYRKYIEKDGALERRFQPVMVEEPTIEETIDILKGIRTHYEEFHRVRISDAVIEEAVRMSERYITDRFLPDKAIDVVDEAASRANLRNVVLAELESLRNEVADINAREEEIAAEQIPDEETEEARNERFKVIAELKSRRAVAESRIKALEPNEFVDIIFDDVARVIEIWTGIPVQTVTEQEAERLLKLESRLKEKVIGQDKAIAAVSKAIRRNRSGFRKRYKPSSFIFVGSTGVGKTELVKQLTIEMFGNLDALVRFDMSEFMEKHTVSKLIGSPPGYVGYDEAGQLTEKVRRHPYSVVLFDEIEKAHTDVFNLLLQILDDGRLTDSQGRTVNFENTIIVMTSNAANPDKGADIGFFGANDAANREAETHAALKKIFRPEFLNRIDEIVMFNALDKESLLKITALMVNEVSAQCRDRGITLEITDEAISYICENGFDEKYGARPLRRFIQKKIEDELADLSLQGKLSAGDRVNVKVMGSNIVIDINA